MSPNGQEALCWSQAGGLVDRALAVGKCPSVGLRLIDRLGGYDDVALHRCLLCFSCRPGAFRAWRALYSHSTVSSKRSTEALWWPRVHDSHTTVRLAYHHGSMVGLRCNSHFARSAVVLFPTPVVGVGRHVLGHRRYHATVFSRAASGLACFSVYRRSVPVCGHHLTN